MAGYEDLQGYLENEFNAEIKDPERAKAMKVYLPHLVSPSITIHPNAMPISQVVALVKDINEAHKICEQQSSSDPDTFILYVLEAIVKNHPHIKPSQVYIWFQPLIKFPTDFNKLLDHDDPELFDQTARIKMSEHQEEAEKNRKEFDIDEDEFDLGLNSWKGGPS